MNKSIVTFTRGTLAQATPLWQYDYGQILEINGLDLPSTYQVHFCNCSDTQTITVLGNADGVLIPDNLLQTGKTVIAYIYLHTGADDGETEYKITIPIRTRPAPSDIPPTPEQQSALDEAIAALNSAVEDVEEIADGIPDQINAALEEAKESGEFDGAPGAPGTDGADGNNIWYDNSSLIESSSDVAARLADLEGRTGVSPAADDIVFAKAPRSGHIDTMYIIRRVWGPLADLTFVATITGPQGDPGFSPVARVTEIEGGHCVTIYDLAHPDGQSFDVLDGAAGPEGPPGRDGEITEALKQALLQLAQKVAYIDDQGQTYYQALYDALYPPKELVSISAVYTQSSTVYDTDSLDSLKTDLVVTGTYDDQTTATIPASDYTLTGTLTAGTSTITVTCSGKTTTFTVVVTHAPGVFAVTNTLSGCTNSNTATSVAEGASYSGTITANSGYTLTGATVSITMGGVDITASAYSSGSISIASVTGALVINVAAVAVVLNSISAVYTQSGTVYDTDNLDSLKDDLVVTAVYSDSSTQTVPAADYTLSGTLTVGTTAITVSYGGKTTTFNVTVTDHRQVPTDYTWLYEAKNGTILSNDSFIAYASTGTITETITDGILRINAHPTGSGTTGTAQFKLNDTTTTDAVLSFRGKLVAGGVQNGRGRCVSLTLSNGTSGATSVLWINTTGKIGVTTWTGSSDSYVADYATEKSASDYHIFKLSLHNGTQSLEIDGEVIFSLSNLSTFYTTMNRFMVQSLGTVDSTADVDWIAYKEN